MEEEVQDKKPKHKTKLVQASLKNVQKQKQLAMELNEIDRQMEIEVKIINREKLEAIKDYVRLESEKRTVEYLNDGIKGAALKRYNQHRRDRDHETRDEKDNKEKYDFKLLTSKLFTKLPSLEIPELLKENVPEPPKKPRLYRSNSLMRQRSVSENSLLMPVQFSASLRKPGTPQTQYTSLPDINKYDKTNKKLFLNNHMPDIDEKSEGEPPRKFIVEKLPHLGRSRTFY